MEWLNTSVTFLNSPEFRRSTHVQRGIWLTLMGYCVQQENSGVIKGTEPWTAWDWQQVLGVDPEPVKQDCTLWHWEDGAVLVLHGYPVEKEAEVRAKRRAGRKGGLSSGQARAKHSGSTASSTASTERKGNRKGRGIEREGERKKGAGSAPVRPSLDEWLTHAASVHPEWPADDARAAWAHYEAAGWKLGRGRPVVDWRAAVETCHARWASQKTSRDRRRDSSEFDPHRPNAHTGGLPVFESAAGDEPAAAAGGER